MAARSRRLPFRVPLAEGQLRCRLRRVHISLDPATFDRLRAICLERDEPMSWVASDLIEQAISGINTNEAKGGG